MNPDDLHRHLSAMTQEQVHKQLKYEVKNSESLFKKRNAAEKAECESMQQKRKTKASWDYSEQYEISKENIKIIVKYLL